jgi:UDP-N-acetylglucosamine acyltransferase
MRGPGDARSVAMPAGARIHPMALVDPRAYLGAGVTVGPFAIVEAGVAIGDRCRVMAGAFIAAGSDIAADCEIHMYAVVGHRPQIRDFEGPGGGVCIGSGTIVREHVTVHASRDPNGLTRIGRNSFLLAGCHIAHDCRIGDSVTIANGALLAGHVALADRVFVSGNVVVHQFVQVGELAMIGGQARVSKDVPPFMLVVGDSRVRGVNVVGMRRAGWSAGQRRSVRDAYGILYRSSLNVSDALARLRNLPDSPEVRSLIGFIEHSTRGICAAGTPVYRTSRARSGDPKVLSAGSHSD